MGMSESGIAHLDCLQQLRGSEVPHAQQSPQRPALVQRPGGTPRVRTLTLPAIARQCIIPHKPCSSAPLATVRRPGCWLPQL